MNQSELYFKDLEDDKPHVLFVGGCGEFGMNLTLYIYKRKVYVVDCGLLFAPEHEIGIDAHIPNIDEIFEYFGGPAVYFITHGHEDHVGGLPLFLEKWPAPIFMTKWTSLILRDRVEKFGSRVVPDVTLVAPGDRIKSHDISLDWYGVPHSIPGCCSLVLYFGDIKVFHTGDFKMDPKPPLENPPDLDFLKSIAPVDVLISDSTNSQSSGMCPSELDIIEPLKIAIQSRKKLVIVTTFASNLWRLLSLVKIAKDLNKKLYFSGISLFKTLEYATEIGYFTPDPLLILDDDGFKTCDRSKVIVVASGSQGEPRSGLRRIIMGEHRNVSLEPGDHIIFSSRVIPGNEKSVSALVSHCHLQGVEVTTTRQNPNIHVSGHAHQEDLKILIDTLQPKQYIPVHGTHTQLLANGQLSANAISISNGSLLKLSSSHIEFIGEFDLERSYIDSWSYRPMSYEDMRSRHKIGDSGLILITGNQDKDVEIEYFGIPFSQTEQLSCSNSILNLIKKSKGNSSDREQLNELVRRESRRMIASRLIKKPVVICKL